MSLQNILKLFILTKCFSPSNGVSSAGTISFYFLVYLYFYSILIPVLDLNFTSVKHFVTAVRKNKYTRAACVLTYLF